jgi:hypothetical protein
MVPTNGSGVSFIIMQAYLRVGGPDLFYQSKDGKKEKVFDDLEWPR